MTAPRVIPTTLLTFQQVCALYPQPRRLITLKAYRAAGQIPHLKIGNRVYFRLQDVEVWMVERVFTRLGLMSTDGAPELRSPRAPMRRAGDQPARRLNGGEREFNTESNPHARKS